MNSEFDLKLIVRKNIWELKPYSSARSEFDLYGLLGQPLISSTEGEHIDATSQNSPLGEMSAGQRGLTLLDANENPESAQNLNRYPDPLQSELKAELAKQKRISKDQIFIGNGSDEAIDLLYRIFCEPGKDKALICPPTYGMYEVSAAINDVEVVRVPLKKDFSFDLNEILNRVQGDRKVKMIWICSPNNPTGNALLKADLKHDWQTENYTRGGMMDMPFSPEFEQEMLENQRKLDQLFGNFNGIIVVDEAYHDFTDNVSFINRLDDYPNLVVLQTMSKAQGLAGARVGFAFAGKEIIELFNKTKPPYNVNELSQKAALQALKNKTATEKSIAQLVTNRKWLADQLTQFDFVKKVYPSEANFILAEVENANQLYNYLKDNNVIVRNRHSQIPNTIRFTVGTRLECENVIKTLDKLN
ncbi:histidinol-phosphate aminotransferase [Nonlabens spongiae]|uniref:Histidinol-phosphate aminotransferase n=2 Tax=Nonlabens spongiae TaxID=331648 RepID=A0A1W6MKG0_9FLAO|nr:histidinol-phosphate aminotransferase [Nonlabens spongiae]